MTEPQRTPVQVVLDQMQYHTARLQFLTEQLKALQARGEPEQAYTRDHWQELAIETVGCPFCHAPKGEPCKNMDDGTEVPGVHGSRSFRRWALENQRREQAKAGITEGIEELAAVEGADIEGMGRGWQR